MITGSDGGGARIARSVGRVVFARDFVPLVQESRGDCDRSAFGGPSLAENAR